MAQKHDILYTEKPMTVGTQEQGPQKRYRRLRFPSFDADVWAEKNPLLQKGELGHEKDTGRFKVGDGVTYWADLPYNSVGESAKINGYNVLEIIAGENVEIRQDGNVLIIDVAIGSIKNDLDDLGDQVSGIEEKIPESASATNQLVTKEDLKDVHVDLTGYATTEYVNAREQEIRDDVNQADSELQSQITAQAAEIATKQDQLTAGDNIIISGNIISATGAGGGVGFDVIIVQELPATGQKGIIYLVPKDSAAPDVYDEYIWVTTTSTFELIGSTKVDLTDYVKNTDIATYNNAGLVKQLPQSGIVVQSDGGLIIASASPEQVSAKTSHCLPIVPSRLDYAVKVGVTTNTIALTDEEKAAAQTWLGIESGLPDQAGNEGKVLSTNGTDAEWTDMPGLIIRSL